MVKDKYVLIPSTNACYLTIAGYGFFFGRLRVPTQCCDLVVSADWGWGRSNQCKSALPIYLNAFLRKFFRRSKVNKPKQSMRMLPHLSLPCPIDDRFFFVTIFCLKSTCNWQTCRVIGFSSPSRLSPLLSGKDAPETAQWHASLYIKKAFVKDESAPALF